MLLRTRAHQFDNKVYLTKGGIWALGLVVPKKNNVLGLLQNERGKILVPARNVVTNDGDVYYAERMAAETPTNTFVLHELFTAGTTAKTATWSTFTMVGAAASQKTTTGGYPKTDDADTDNTGAGTDICTWLAEWTKADFNATGIAGGVITNAGPGASEPLLTGYDFAASFDKTANDTLKVFVNHEALGV